MQNHFICFKYTIAVYSDKPYPCLELVVKLLKYKGRDIILKLDKWEVHWISMQNCQIYLKLGYTGLVSSGTALIIYCFEEKKVLFHE